MSRHAAPTLEFKVARRGGRSAPPTVYVVKDGRPVAYVCGRVTVDTLERVASCHAVAA